MPSASTPRIAVSELVIGAIGAALVVLSTSQGSRSDARLECESGVLDAGQDGMNQLVYELCQGRLTIGFRNSDVIEEITCGPSGDVELWFWTHDVRCEDERVSDRDRVHEIQEPLRGAGRATAVPVRQLLTCRPGMMNEATIVVPDARDAILETRTGDTKYERVSKRFISQCIRPDT